MSEQIQHLINQWDARPRRQLDYSGLTDASIADLEWTNSILKALIKAIPVITEKFGMTAEAPIMLEMPAPTARMAPGVIPARTLPLTSPTALPPAPVVDAPSNAAEKPPKKGRSTRTPKASRKKADTASSTGRKAGIADKPASVPATPPPAPAPERPPRAPSPIPPAIARIQSDNPPPPKLEPIG